MRRVAFLLAALGAPVVATPFGGAPVVADAELAAMRGGILLPNGLDLSIGITIETRIDGQLALRTVAGTDGRLQVYSGGASATPTLGATASAATPAAPMVTIDRGGAGTVITPGAAMLDVPVSVSLGHEPPDYGGMPLPLQPNGPAADTGFGRVALEQTANGSAVVLTDPTLQLRHLVGTATGVVVANTADNRAIDTVANVNIDLGNATALLGSNVLAIDALAADAAARNPFR